MDNETATQVEADQKILTFDVSDDAVERAASAQQNAFTMLYCTNDWYNCGLGTVRVPMLVRILRTYQLPEILMVAAATLFVVVSAAYRWGG